MKLCLTFVVLILLLLSGTASAATISVSGTTGTDIQHALDAASSGDTIIIPSGDYTVTSTLRSKNKNLNIYGNEGTNIYFNTGQSWGMSLSGDTILTTKPSAKADEGDTQITLQDSRGVKPGQFISIYNSKKWAPLDQPSQKTGEMYLITHVDGNEITLNEQLLRDYSKSDHVEIHEPVEINIKNINFYNSDATQRRSGVVIDYCIHSSVSDCVFRNHGSCALKLSSCWESTVKNNEVYNGLMPGNGYGIAIYDGSAYCNIENNYAKNCRHCICLSASKFKTLNRAIIARNNVVVGADIQDSFVIDSHEMTIDYTVKNNKIYVQDGFAAFQDGTLNSVFIGNDIYGGREYRKRGNVNGGSHIIDNNLHDASGFPDTVSNVIEVGKCDGNSDQEQINDAIEQAESGDTVFLPAKTYFVDGPINIQCSGVTLLGEEGTIIKVARTSTQWFEGLTGIINSVGFDDITIRDILIDGSCDELDNSLADSSSATSHDCERAIVIQGSSGDFVKNIVIKNVIVINTFSDGVHVRCAENVIVDSCEMSNCQHDSIYFVLVRNGIMTNNEIAGITADCIRFDNCEYSKAVYNTLFSYSGSQSNGAYLHGENAVQIGDQGYSYGGGDPGKSAIIHTNNIEVAYNKIINCGLEAVLLDAANLGLGENIYIHENDIIGDEEFETSGIPVEILDGIEDVKNGKTPTQEQSEEVFDSVFDYMGLTSEYSYVSDTSYNSYYEGKLHTNTNDVDCVFETHVTIDGSYTLIKIDTTDISSITYTINGSVSKHIVKIGVRQGMNVIYSDSSIWIGNAEHDIYGNVFLNNTINLENVSVQCTTPSGDVNVNKVHTIVNDGGTSINEKLLICLLIVLLPALCGVILLRKLIRTIVRY